MVVVVVEGNGGFAWIEIKRDWNKNECPEASKLEKYNHDV